jgi:hypothetical protein
MAQVGVVMAPVKRTTPEVTWLPESGFACRAKGRMTNALNTAK